MTEIKNYHYTVTAIETGFEVKVFDGIQQEPFLLQPFNPDNNNLAWQNEEEANAWAEKQIELCIERDSKPSPQTLDPLALMLQAQEDSERLKKVENTLLDILKKLS